MVFGVGRERGQIDKAYSASFPSKPKIEVPSCEVEPSKATYMPVGEVAATAAAAGRATSVAGAVRRGDAVLMVWLLFSFLPEWVDEDQWSERRVERGRGSGSLLGWAGQWEGGDLAGGHDRCPQLPRHTACLWWSG